MIVERGRVIELTDETARIELTPERHGKSCHGCGLCDRREGRMVLEAPRDDLHEGDRVEVDIEGLGVWWAIVLVQVVPIAALVLGGVLGYLLVRGPHRDLAAAVGAVAGFVVVLVLARYLVPARYRSGEPTVRSVRKIEW